MRSCFLFVSAALLLSVTPVGAQQTGTEVTGAQETGLESLSLSKKIKLAKAGDEEAKMAVAEAYEFGRGTEPDLAQAAFWYREAALGKNLDAQYRLANIVKVGAKGLTRDLPTAIKLFTAAAESGHAGSQYELAKAYQTGSGVLQDDEKAFGWYEKAATQKFARAESNLGLLYLFGKGTKVNADKALDLFARATAQDDGWAMNNLAGMYEQGWATKRDLAKARELYVKAAAKGISIAETNLKRVNALVPGNAAVQSNSLPPPDSSAQ